MKIPRMLAFGLAAAALLAPTAGQALTRAQRALLIERRLMCTQGAYNLNTPLGRALFNRCMSGRGAPRALVHPQGPLIHPQGPLIHPMS